jgi:hypothetical protein
MGNSLKTRSNKFKWYKKDFIKLIQKTQKSLSTSIFFIYTHKQNFLKEHIKLWKYLGLRMWW